MLAEPPPNPFAHEDSALAARERTDAEWRARRDLRAQIDRMERRLAERQASRFPTDRSRLIGAHATSGHAGALQTLGDLERTRDHLIAAHAAVDAREAEVRRNRDLLSLMQEHPRLHEGKRLTSSDLGEPGCHVYTVGPWFGPIGRLGGWWRVKISSGCPLPPRGAHAVAQVQGPRLGSTWISPRGRRRRSPAPTGPARAVRDRRARAAAPGPRSCGSTPGCEQGPA